MKVEIHLGNQFTILRLTGTQLSYIFQNICSTPSLNFSCLKIPPCLKQNNAVGKDDIREMSDLKVKRICHHFNPLQIAFSRKSCYKIIMPFRQTVKYCVLKDIFLPLFLKNMTIKT